MSDTIRDLCSEMQIDFQLNRFMAQLFQRLINS